MASDLTQPAGMRYWYAYRFIFQSPQWTMNVLWGLVAIFIPVIGPLVLLGYQYEIVESLHRRPDRTYPDFNINRFVEYLTRGVWPFLVSLVVTLPISFALVAVYFVSIFSLLMAAEAHGEPPVLAFGLAMVVFMIVCMGLSVLMQFFLQPMMLRAALTQSFGEGFKLAWVRGFIGRVWLEMLLSMLFLMFTSTVFAMLGLLVFCIGMYAAIAFVMLAQAHIHHQLYELYLARGGEEVPLKEAPKPPMRPTPPGGTV